MNSTNSVQYGAGIVTVIAALVLITPLCGFLFDCGCVWPWEGLERHCNIHDPDAVHQCPWCVSTLAGVVSVGLAVLVGFLLSIKSTNSGYDMRDSALAGRQQTASTPDSMKRILMGLLGFFVTAVVTGWVSGYLQGYPYFALLSDWPI